MFQTVHDQDFTLQTSNAILDLTVGLFSGSHSVTGSSTGVDSAGKVLFPSHSLMMREKVDIYRQFAQSLLGSADSHFQSPFATDAVLPNDLAAIDEALFISFKRLFARDKIKRESFAMKFFQTASLGGPGSSLLGSSHVKSGYDNLRMTSEVGSAIYTDVGSSAARETSYGGQVGNLVDASNTDRKVGLLFYDRGIAILDMKKVMSGNQHASGAISAAEAATTIETISIAAGKTVMGSAGAGVGNRQAKFIPDFMVSGSMDDIINHVATCRFGSGSNTGITFQNTTQINSTLFFCRATANEFNLSSNPSYRDSQGAIRAIEDATVDKPFSFVTSVGLYDSRNNLLAVAKLSRPVEKNDEKDVTFRVRLDF